MWIHVERISEVCNMIRLGDYGQQMYIQYAHLNVLCFGVRSKTFLSQMFWSRSSQFNQTKSLIKEKST